MWVSLAQLQVSLALCLPCIDILLIWFYLVANLMECLVCWAARVG